MADPDKEVRQMIFLLCEKNMEINKKKLFKREQFCEIVHELFS